jgi:Nuclease-related domain
LAPPAEESVPGPSARQIYERRREARENRDRERYGRIGGWKARMSARPQHERAWAKGAVGEAKNARRLEKLLDGQPVELLHDRRLPGRRANIDHIAIGPGGVTVIDSKNLEGKVRIDWRGGLFSHASSICTSAAGDGRTSSSPSKGKSKRSDRCSLAKVSSMYR